MFGAEVIPESYPDLHVRAVFSTEALEFVTWTDGLTDAGYQKHVQDEVRAMAARVRRREATT
jgi:hypothetical protein